MTHGRGITVQDALIAPGQDPVMGTGMDIIPGVGMTDVTIGITGDIANDWKSPRRLNRYGKESRRLAVSLYGVSGMRSGV
jgi:hypothetical protein